MSTTKQKQLDCMGFDRMQLASIKRNYANNKPIYTKMDRIAVKVNALIAEHKQLQSEAAMSDLYTRNLAKKVTGYDLTSDVILKFHNDPEAWEKFKAENPLTTEEPAQTETAEIPTEEPVDTPEEGENVAAPAEEDDAEPTPVPAQSEAPAETPAETTEETPATDPFGE